MFSKKGLSEFVSLCLISKSEFKYSSTDIKMYLETQFCVKPEVIYPMLRKLHNEELVDFRWSDSTSSPRKEYKILPKGMEKISQNMIYLEKLFALTRHLGTGDNGE